MKILQYNLLDGCKTLDRYEPFLKWLSVQDYDVVGFNELNDWTEVEFQREMDNCGYPFTCLFQMDSSPYFIGVAAKSPITLINKLEDSPFYHGMLHVKVHHINFLVTHLCPFESVKREKEAEAIVKYIHPFQEPVIVMGDFNTFSPLDQDFYELDKILARERKVMQHIQNGKINYRPMEILLEAGLHDINDEEKLDFSMPTEISNSKDPFYSRLDYVLVNDYLLKKNPTAKVLRNTEVAKLSDHYPIECELDDYLY
ncbi:endonuclease/exonuclease/phosphatase family protein [Bacillus timonensis]|uniref:endonuclease/exonuclease/phosphatase family protein n=1 Tax=Bacillus timonensis TaxID=1033734 RepID=UPI000288FF6A|nr:endonuclease/exonuclease/phosphatase family protein [Bacillus timonensis]